MPISQGFNANVLCRLKLKIALEQGKKVIFTVTASEDLPVGAHVSLLFDDSNQIYVRKSSTDEFPDAIAARNILKGDVLFFNTGRSTSDLARPKGYFSLF